jgi:DNA-directed RNA polymerase subunit omega
MTGASQGNRFQLVLVAAHRARMIRQGSPLTIDRDKDKDPVIALREIAEESIDIEAVLESYIAGLQDIQPGAEGEKEEDNRALLALPQASEEEILRTLQAEVESNRDDRF